MLKGIPSIISPELLKILMEMGHGDELVIGDGNFPAASNAKRLVRADGHGTCELLEAILKLFPLDGHAASVLVMATDGPDVGMEIPIWADYEKIAGVKPVEIERYAFYERARNAYAILATGESAIYANIILKKGVVKE